MQRVRVVGTQLRLLRHPRHLGQLVGESPQGVHAAQAGLDGGEESGEQDRAVGGSCELKNDLKLLKLNVINPLL